MSEGVAKKVKQGKGVRIVCEIKTIEYDEGIEKGNCVLTVSETIDKIETSMKTDINKRNITLPDLGNVTIESKGKPMVSVVGGEGAVAVINL